MATRYAVIIGVEHYKSFSPTAFAHADADLICHTLTALCDYPAQHTLLLKLDPVTGMGPLQVLEKIRQAVNDSTAGDSILFYFAGHGHSAGPQTYLILPDTLPGAYETTALSLDDISRELRQTSAGVFSDFRRLSFRSRCPRQWYTTRRWCIRSRGNA